MDSMHSVGGLIPLWILGAPFLCGVFMLMSMRQPERPANVAASRDSSAR